MIGIVFVPPFTLAAALLLIYIFRCISLADRPRVPMWAQTPTSHGHPSWSEYDPQALAQAAREASREIALARRELALIDHFDWSAWAMPEPTPVEYLPRRELVAA